jgi:hypothetical protein
MIQVQEALSEAAPGDSEAFDRHYPSQPDTEAFERHSPSQPDSKVLERHYPSQPDSEAFETGTLGDATSWTCPCHDRLGSSDHCHPSHMGTWGGGYCCHGCWGPEGEESEWQRVVVNRGR